MLPDPAAGTVVTDAHDQGSAQARITTIERNKQTSAFAAKSDALEGKLRGESVLGLAHLIDCMAR